jgi:8-oxo-dGTP diphosphatase
MGAGKRGCGVLFYDRKERRVLLYRRDKNLGIAFPNSIDILGGHIEDDETPKEAVVREMAEELDDLRTGRPFKLEKFELYKFYVDEWGVKQFIFWAEANFELKDLRLKEGAKLLWLDEKSANSIELAFGFEKVVREFFRYSSLLGQGR